MDTADAIARAHADGVAQTKRQLGELLGDKLVGIRFYLEKGNIDCALANLASVERHLARMGIAK